ncbi:MAG: threonine ammonia-lyase [Bacillota bacterium]
MFFGEDFEAVRERIKPYIHTTPIINSNSLNNMIGNKLFLKLESMQKTGSFKIRGAASKVTSLDGQNLKGIVTASSGNHGQAVAYMAKTLSIKSVIVVPNTAPEAKLNAIKGYGAEIIIVGPKSNERLEMAGKISQEMGYVFVPPYDDYDVIKGQGTIGLEILEEKIPIEKIFIPIGGGGLLSGIAAAIKAINPSIQVVGVEPVGSSCMYTSLKNGRRTEISPNTIADGLRTAIPGEKTFSLVQRYVDDVVLVEEREIKDALKMVMERMKVIIEPSGAVPIAAMLKEKATGAGLLSVVSGGNLDIMKIPELLA